MTAAAAILGAWMFASATALSKNTTSTAMAAAWLGAIVITCFVI